MNYNLKWRNAIVKSVDWEEHIITYKFDGPTFVIKAQFDKIWNNIDSTDDLQAIKMIMDRIMLHDFCHARYQSLMWDFFLNNYIIDVILNPYEDLHEYNITSICDNELFSEWTKIE